MEADLQIEQLKCSQCTTLLHTEDVFCPNCGFPERGTDKEKSVFHANKVMEKHNVSDVEKKIKNARNALYVMAGFTFIYGVGSFFQEDIATAVVNGVLCLIYMVLAMWTKQKPLMAILLGLLLYLTTIIINAVVDPMTLAKGILFKIIVIAYLGKGVYHALSIDKKHTV